MHAARDHALPAFVWGLSVSALAVLLIPFFVTGHGVTLLLSAIAAGTAVVVLRWPYAGILVTITVLTLELSPEAISSRFLQIPWLVGALLAIPFAMKVLGERRIPAISEPPIQLLVAISGLYLLSTGWSAVASPEVLSPGIDKTRWMLVAILSRFAFLLLFLAFITTFRRIEAVVWLFVALTALAALDSWAGFSGSGAVERAAADFGPAANSNRLGFLCLAGTAFLWYFHSQAPRSSRGVVLPLLIALPITAFATGSRSALLQGLVLAGIILSEQRRASAGRRVATASLLAAAVLAVVTVIPPQLLERATTFDPTVRNRGQKSLESRAHAVQNAFALYREHPVLGVGIGNFESLTVPLHEMGRGVHNSYLRALVEGGPLVLGLYLLLFATTLRSLRHAVAHAPPDWIWLARALRAAFLLLLVFSLTADIWHGDHFYLLLGLSIAFAARVRASATHPSEVGP